MWLEEQREELTSSRGRDASTGHDDDLLCGAILDELGDGA